MAREQIARLNALILALLFGLATTTAASPKWCDSMRHQLSAELRSAYHLTSHFIFRPEGKPLNDILSFHARYSFSFSKDSRLGKLYPTAYQGIGLGTYTYFNHSLMGTPMVLYIMQGGRIANLSSTISVGYEWNFGFSWGWHPNGAMNSHYNVMVNVAIPFTWRCAPHWEISLTPDYTHFSNGDTHFANAGSDMFGLRLGATYLFDPETIKASARRYISSSEQLQNRSFWQHMTYDIIAYGAWRRDRFIENKHLYYVDEPLPVAGLNFQPTYHLNNHFGLGASLDMQYDSSLNLYDGVWDENRKTIAYSRPPFWQQCEIGAQIRGEISAPIFTIGIGVGINFIRHGYDASLLYTTFTLKAHLTKRLFIHIGYRRNTTQYTHNLMYGLGIRI